MKILYGVQGTGNGHLSRARAMAKHFNLNGVDVSYIFTGRSREGFFDMEEFGDFKVFKGLTLATRNGRVSYLKTVFESHPLQFIYDVVNLDLSPYDFILCDFEPVTAWAGKLRGKKVVCIGHQPAFHYDIPMMNKDPIALAVMNFFSPATTNIGLHWHHYDAPILPPIIHIEALNIPVEKNKVMVYLPFESVLIFKPLFHLFQDFQFYFYHPEFTAPENHEHLHFRPLSVHQFQQDLQSSELVICSAGFELPSECIHLGKRLLVKPLKNQMEQVSNAAALETLRLGEATNELTQEVIGNWLYSEKVFNSTQYPDVAEALVKWIVAGQWNNMETLKHQLWDAVTANP